MGSARRGGRGVRNVWVVWACGLCGPSPSRVQVPRGAAAFRCVTKLYPFGPSRSSGFNQPGRGPIHCAATGESLHRHKCIDRSGNSSAPAFRATRASCILNLPPLSHALERGSHGTSGSLQKQSLCMRILIPFALLPRQLCATSQALLSEGRETAQALQEFADLSLASPPQPSRWLACRPGAALIVPYQVVCMAYTRPGICVPRLTHTL